MNKIEFRSDNVAGVAPEILASIADANHGSAISYGHDEVTARLEQRVRQVFEHDTARVFPVTSGTAANALALTALCPPWGSVLCHSNASCRRASAQPLRQWLRLGVDCFQVGERQWFHDDGAVGGVALELIEEAYNATFENPAFRGTITSWETAYDGVHEHLAFPVCQLAQLLYPLA